MQPTVVQPLSAVLMFFHQGADFTVVQHLNIEQKAAATVEKGPCPLWSLVIFGPLAGYTSSEVSGIFLQLQLVSVMMLYFLNRHWPPVLSSLTSPSTFPCLLYNSDCNFSISGWPHRKCIHPNNHMFSNTQEAINDV